MSRDDFWSRRKAAVEAEEATAETKANATAVDDAAAEKSDEDILEELGLPDPDTLEDGDDFQAFLDSAVPTRLRNRALRKLWLTNPVLANVDGLVDYGEDFTDAAMVVENLQTAYQVGKGMTKHVMEMLRQEEEAQREAEEMPEPVVEIAAESTDDDAEETEQTPAPAPEPAVAAPTPDHTNVETTNLSQDNYGKPRRMRYSFQNAPGEDA